MYIKVFHHHEATVEAVFIVQTLQHVAILWRSAPLTPTSLFCRACTPAAFPATFQRHEN